MAKSRKNTGTKEWAAKNVNILAGCSHGCLYCYGMSIARRFKRIESNAEWVVPKLLPHVVDRRWRLARGPVMFPTTHDITPEFLDSCIVVLRNLLIVGNQLLIVSKPHLPCIERICEEFDQYKPQILFRFTIGAIDDQLFAFWEPGAPKFEERLACLKYAFKNGFKTSVSMEPMLDASQAVKLFRKLAPFVTDSIWLGKMNRIRACVGKRTAEMEAAIRRIEEHQTNEKIKVIYENLKQEPLVRWKDSIKKVIGLPLAANAGADR